MSTPENQAEALAKAAGIRRRDDLVVYRVSGDDQRSWLNGQVTNDIRHTQPGQGVYGLAITVKGRIMADLWVMDLGDDNLHVAMPKVSAEEVIARFDSQIIMEDVELERLDALSVISVQGPQAELATACVSDRDGVWRVEADELGLGGHFVLSANAEELWPELLSAVQQAGGMELDEAGWELARIRLSVPRFDRDFGASSYPQEAGLKARAVSFNKGCYVGQEVVCTLENRGRLSRSLYQLQADAPLPPETVLRSAGKDVGRVTSSTADGRDAPYLALGFVKRAAAEAGTALESDAGPVSIRARVGD